MTDRRHDPGDDVGGSGRRIALHERGDDPGERRRRCRRPPRGVGDRGVDGGRLADRAERRPPARSRPRPPGTGRRCRTSGSPPRATARHGGADRRRCAAPDPATGTRAAGGRTAPPAPRAPATRGRARPRTTSRTSASRRRPAHHPVARRRSPRPARARPRRPGRQPPTDPARRPRPHRHGGSAHGPPTTPPPDHPGPPPSRVPPRSSLPATSAPVLVDLTICQVDPIGRSSNRQPDSYRLCSRHGQAIGAGASSNPGEYDEGV